MELLRRAKALEAEGADVVHMEIGEPDFPTPAEVVSAGIESIRGGEVKYTPAAGLPDLRAAIARFYADRYGVHLPARRIFVTPGASGAFTLILAGLLERGDEVLLSDPGYPCYPNFVRLFGGEPRLVPVGAASNFQFDARLLSRHWAPTTRGVVMASPSNPTGTLASGASLREIAGLLDERDAFWLSDEIYHGLVYGERAHSALEFSDRAFVVNSFSKYFGMTGWRLGWAIVPDDFVDAAERLAQNLFISAPTHSQMAALAAFSPANLDELEGRRREFAVRRDFLLHELSGLGFDIPVRPEGAFYVYADCSRWSDDSFELAWRLLEDAHVAVTPGRDFGSHEARRHLRFAYTASVDRLAEGIARMRHWLYSQK
ncbi:aminotransferase class I/II-fold pyridoxal phosphate-dependent enzyme [Methylococcus sp. EFPC2]|nr:aminotransferase class I/II-fold pyridoxal phosphate-dependent enzyme [Methylococcus sp. EFPC2]